MTEEQGKKKLKKNYQKCPRQRKVKMMRLEHINLRLGETMATGGGMIEDMIETDGMTEVDTTGETIEDHHPDTTETEETIEVTEMRAGTAMKRQRRRRRER